jgi:murein DD-endopeptidase MepM/ murein hydrolase activator NlpD
MPKPKNGTDRNGNGTNGKKKQDPDQKLLEEELEKLGGRMPLYRLPLEPGAGWLVSKGNWDDPKGGHGSGQAYAFDILHKDASGQDDAKGMKVRAARAGLVVSFRNDVSLSTGGWDAKTWDEYLGRHPGEIRASLGGGNHVIIRHADHTAAAYCHMKPNQSFITKKGQWVAQGQVIGLVDDTGSTGSPPVPHLHIDVRLFWNDYSDNGPTVPIHFHDANHWGWRPHDGEPLVPDNSRLFQDYWRWCKKCQGLFFGAEPVSDTIGGKCPKDGGKHDGSSSSNYVLVVNSAAPPAGQPGWRWCWKCQGLFFDKPGSKCPATGEHEKGSGKYALVLNAPPGAPGQGGWRWCQKCQGLWMGENAGSVCPADGKAHAAGSGQYTLWDRGADTIQQHWRWCAKCQGLFFGDRPGSVCPADHTEHLVGSGNYALPLKMPDAPGQQDWRWCAKCQGLFFGDRPSVCPADKMEHLVGESGSYALVFNAPKAPGEADWRWCENCGGLFFAKNSGSVCPVGGKPHQQAPTGADYTLLSDRIAS